jgi:hypothetical protein
MSPSLPDCQLELRQVPTRNNRNDASLFLVIQECNQHRRQKMRKLALALVAAITVAATTLPAAAQVGFYAGPGGIGVGVGPGYYGYYGGPYYHHRHFHNWHHWHHGYHW